MKIRHILILVCSAFILILIVMVGIMAYGAGVNFGEIHAEEIRADRIKATHGIIESKKYVDAKLALNDTSEIIISSHGKVVSTSAIQLSTEVQGKISTAINLKKGTRFEKGQVLFTIRDTEARLALEARKSAYMNQIVQILPDLKIDYNDNFQVWSDFFVQLDVQRPLPKFPSLGSLKEKNFIISKNLLAEYLRIKSDEDRLAKYTITAPFDGSIIEAFTDEGAIVNPGAPVANIIRTEKMEIEITVKASQIGLIAMNQVVELTDSKNETYRGRVTRIGEYINPSTQTVPIFIDITEKSEKLYNGMYLDARLKSKGRINALEIPRSAIFGQNQIFVIAKNNNNDCILITQKIEIVDLLANSAVISGLPDSTIIVTSPVIGGRDSLIVSPIFK